MRQQKQTLRRQPRSKLRRAKTFSLACAQPRTVACEHLIGQRSDVIAPHAIGQTATKWAMADA